MRHLQVIPRGAYRLYAALTAKEAELSRNDRGTFRRRGPKRKSRAQWTHSRFHGRVKLACGTGEVVEIEVRTKKGAEWQLLGAILGFIDRHFGHKVRAINIHYGG